MSSIRNIGKHYVFTDESWWDDNGCSCCDPLEMTYYNCDEPELAGMGSATSEEGIVLILAVVCNIITQEQFDEDGVTADQVDKLLKNYGITWEVV